MSREEVDLVTVSGMVETKTFNAVLLVAGGQKVWIPKSQIFGPSGNDPEIGEEVELDIPEWLAIEKGLE